MSDTIEIICAHEGGPAEGCETGEPAVLVRLDAECPDCKEVHDMEVCPLCGSDIHLGFGLGFGPGFGPYKLCLDENNCGCNWTWKRSLPHDEA